ncbi:hypothetical protein ACQP2E_21570 [Actinoplanes sp. CA-015351]|uniref:nSTAND1 domain-containing NTPase n=1 Tax=Actinoplanes sp. CA-015351 TaxID=3239897 RepID=UPI003D954DBE
MNPIDDEPLFERMRQSVAAAVATHAQTLREASAPAVVGVLSVAALAPIVAATGGAAGVLGAGAGVVGSVGANILTNVIADAIERLKDHGDDGRAQLAERIAAAFRTDEDRELRSEIISLFQSADLAGAALRSAAAGGDPDLAPALGFAFAQLSDGFSAAITDLRDEVRREAAQHSSDRERSRRMAADLARVLDLLSAEHSGEVFPAAFAWKGCPYRGLLPFEEHHAAVFHGRHELTRRLVARVGERLGADGLLLVVGPSGAGKSSLLRAGLLHALANDQVAADSSGWPRRVITPTADPVLHLATHLADLCGSDAITTQHAVLAEPSAAHLLVKQALLGSPGARLVLVVDQFEELFTLVTDHAVRQAYLDALVAMTPDAIVVLGVRGDFLDQAMGWPAVRDAVEAGPFAVGAMSEAELREAITGPAARAGVAVPAELTDAIVDDLRDRTLPTGFDTGVLPLLSQTLFVMWPGGLSLDGYRRTGGVADIVRSSADGVYAALPPDRQEIARRVFLHLVVVVDGRPARRPASRSALLVSAGPDLDAVLEAFAERRLLVLGDDVHIAHEQLIQSWHTLRGWLETCAADQALQRELAEDTAAWRQRRRDGSYLYRGVRLAEARHAVERFAVDPAVTEFLAAGGRRERRRTRAYRATAAALTLLFAGSVAGAVLSTRNAALAEDQSAIALSRQLAAQSRSLPSSERITAQRLAVMALRAAPTKEAYAAASALLIGYHNSLGADGGVQAVTYSRDGRVLAVADDDHVRLWDVGSGRIVGQAAASGIGFLTFSADGTKLAGAHLDATSVTLIWQVADVSMNWQPAVRISVDGSQVAFSPDGDRIVVEGCGDTMGVWDTTTGKRVATLRHAGYGTMLYGVAYSPDGRFIAAGDLDGTIRVWHADSGKPAFAPRAGQVTAVVDAATADAAIADAAIADAAIADAAIADAAIADAAIADAAIADAAIADAAIADAAIADAAIAEAGVEEPRTAQVLFTPDSRTLLALAVDGAVTSWDPATGQRRAVLRAASGGTGQHRAGIAEMAISRDGRLLAVSRAGGPPALLDVATGRPAGTPLTGVPAAAATATATATASESGSEEASTFAFSPDNRTLATGAYGVVRLWDLTGRTPVGAPPVTADGVSALAFSADGARLAIGSLFGATRVFDATTMLPAAPGLITTPSSIDGLAYRTGGTLAVHGADEVSLWDHRGVQHGPVLSGHPADSAGLLAPGVEFSPDGRLLAAGTSGGVPWLWRDGKGAPLAGHRGELSDVAFSPDSKLLATGSSGGVALWDTRTGTLLRTPISGGTDTFEVAFSPDNSFLVTVGATSGVRLWDPAAGDPIGGPLPTPGEKPGEVAFSPDSRVLAVATDAGVIRLWDTRTREQAGIPLTGHTGTVSMLAFRPRGRSLVSSDSTTMQIWDPELFRDPVASLCAQSGPLTPEDWSTYAPDETPRQTC